MENKFLPNSYNSTFSRTKFILGSLLLTALAFAVAGMIFFGWLTEEMKEGETQRFDDAVRIYVHQFTSPMMTEAMRFASFLGSMLFIGIFSVIVFAVFWLLRRRRAAALFAITMGGAGILLITLKTVIHRIRPEPYFDTILPASYSFPSGHALASFCFYGSLAAIITARVENVRIRVVVWICASLIVFWIGISRVYLGVHFPSDVLAGYSAALVWVVAVAVTDRVLRHRKSKIAG